MSAAGKEDIGNTQAEEASQGPALSKDVKEELVVLKGEGIVKEEIKKIEENMGDQDVSEKEISEDCSLLSSKEKGEGECSSDAKDGESFFGNGLFSDMKSLEKKALIDLRSILEEAVLTNKLFKKVNKGKAQMENSVEVKEEDKTPTQPNPIHEEGENNNIYKGKAAVEEEEENESGEPKTEEDEVVDKDISLWGVPLLPSKGDQRTDVLLLKFLRSRDFQPVEAFDMLRGTLEWRKENRIDSITEEDFGNEFQSVGYMKGVDREGHKVCYNVYGVFANEEMYNKTFGSEEGRERFLRWRLQLLEKEILKMDFGPDGISTLVQINDLKDAPGPSRRDLRVATRRVVGILQDNYPEFVAKNIFVNVPFWYYAFNALFWAALTQRTKSKFVFSRPSRVTDTLVKHIAAEEIPSAYGGLRREDDPEFSTEDVASEVIVKAGATETIEIPLPEVGSSLTWDVMIVGWDVNYKEEYVPTDEASYTMIVKKERRINWQQESIRNSFKSKEAGKLAITIENGMFKKKRVLYRYKINTQST